MYLQEANLWACEDTMNTATKRNWGSFARDQSYRSNLTRGVFSARALLRKAFKSLQLSEPSQIRWATSTLFPGPFPTFVDVFRNPVSPIPRSTKSEVGSASATDVDPVASKRTSSALDNLGRISEEAEERSSSFYLYRAVPGGHR